MRTAGCIRDALVTSGAGDISMFYRVARSSILRIKVVPSGHAVLAEAYVIIFYLPPFIVASDFCRIAEPYKFALHNFYFLSALPGFAARPG